MSAGAFIIGGSPAGIQAALDLADTGIRVDLMTVSPFLNRAEPAAGLRDSQNARLLALARHPLVNLWTGTRLTQAAGGPGRFDIGLERQPRYVDLAKCTACGDCIEACPVTVPGENRKAIFLPPGAQPGCAAIDKQGSAPCTHACPGGIPVQGYVAMVAQGRFREALDLIEAAIPFAGICGRICTHPCEVNCRRKEVDAPVAIRALKRFLADWALAQPPPQPPGKTVAPAPDAHPVAVVGSGPAGMTVALRLVRSGHRVTVFEKLPVAGGMMSVGIPAYRLPREVIAREYRRILDLGVELRLNTAVGPDGDHSLDDLFEMGYGAVCLAIGAHRSLQLHIPGENLPGVVHGIELLKWISLSQQLDDPAYPNALERVLRRGPATRALIIGGGNTAMDVSRSLRRLGLEDVRIVYRRSRQEMPATAEEIADTEAEGVAIDFLTAPVAVLGDETNGATGLKCTRMRLAEPDAGGRRRPVPVEGSQFTLAAELIVPAIGQTPDLSVGSALAVNRRGWIQLGAAGFSTSRPGVFAAGDAAAHDRMAVIEAIGMGKQAAAAIDAYLRGGRSDPASALPTRLPEIRKPLGATDRVQVTRVAAPKLGAADATRSFGEIERGYSAAQAIEEAGRCLVCGPCSECMACVEVCKPEAVVHREQPMTAHIQAGALIDARDPESVSLDLLEGCEGVQRIGPDDLVAASAAAAGAMATLSGESKAITKTRAGADANAAARIGVYVCRCMGHISATVDTAAVCQQALRWPGVVCARELDVSCSPAAAAVIRSGIGADNLNRVVLAACSCCTVDQVCFSCTFQRVRCKQNLGVMPVSSHRKAADTSGWADTGLAVHQFEFVNIREQCAWAHRDNPLAATAKAVDLVAAAAAKVRLAAARPMGTVPMPAAVLILGSGGAAESSLEAVNRQGIGARYLSALPGRVERRDGQYVALGSGTRWEGSAVILAPKDAKERSQLLSLTASAASGAELEAAVTDASRPGIFLCHPQADSVQAGAAAAGRAAAWLGRNGGAPAGLTARVDPERCRACYSCVTTCEIKAVTIASSERGSAGRRYAHVDPALCNGCGSCAARCPSNAIDIAAAADAQIEAMIAAVLQ